MINFRNKILKIIGITVLILTIQATAIVYIAKYLREQIDIVKEKQKIILAAKAERFNVVYLKNDFIKVENYISAVNNALPDERNILSAIGQIESIGQNTGNQVSVQINGSQTFIDNLGNRYIAFTAPISGNYRSIRKYLDSLNNLFFVKIESLNFNDGPSTSGISSGSLNGKIYLKD
ncbi:hypothetical protein HZB04_03260 [Candidatus Wolfebacteria bacterium]|nr:hypothetical protein [Candidatus Wolfebacteria bacterium]